MNGSGNGAVKVGKHLSVAHREKISCALKKAASSGELFNDDHRKKISAAARLRRWTPEQRKKLSAAHLGQKAWNKGMNMRAMGYDNWGSPGRIVSLETRKRLSLSHTGQKSWSKGKQLSEAYKGKLSESHKGLIPTANQLAGLALGRSMERRVVYQSRLEKRLVSKLVPFGFVSQFRIAGMGALSKHPYDVGHREKKTVIEVNGCYWHAHGCKEPLIQEHEKVRIRDKSVTLAAQKAGCRLITLWECEQRKWDEQLADVLGQERVAV